MFGGRSQAGFAGALALEGMAVVAGHHWQSRASMMAGLAVAAAIGVGAWLAALHRRRAITDTPTSRIATAAQGFVELQGRGKLFGEQALLSPLTGLPCLWYRFVIEKRDRDNRWRQVQSGTSEVSFIVDDGTGEVLVDPDGAEVMTRHRESWMRDDRRYTEWKLLAGDEIYALGSLRTINGNSEALSASRDVGELLGEWKRDRTALQQRFDLDGDGQIDVHEWALARAAAQREVNQRHREIRQRPDTHLLGRSTDGRPYLLANVDPARLARRLLGWAACHMAAALGAIAAMPWAWSRFS